MFPLKVPLVSVVITNYNYGKYVAEAIRSVAAQTYEKIECVIVDDASTDDSLQVIENCLKSLGKPNFQVIRLAQNSGQMGALKAGLAKTSGAFVNFLDADDVLLPEFIERHVEAHLNSAQSAAVSASDTFQINGDGEALEGTFWLLRKDRGQTFGTFFRPVPDHLQRRIASNGPSPTTPDDRVLLNIDRGLSGYLWSAMSSFVFRRAVVDLIMPASSEECRICADFYLISFAHLISGSLLLSKPLSGFRIHGENGFSKNPVLGGRYTPGTLHHAHRLKMERLISRHTLENIDRFAKSLDLEICRDIIMRFYDPNALYDAMNASPLMKQYMRPKWKYWFTFGILHKRILSHFFKEKGQAAG